LNTQLITKLEHDIENLQKDRDSVFYLDDSFYNKLMDLYINKEEPKRVTDVNDNQATIDEERVNESKEQELESSYTSEDNKSIISEEDDESQLDSQQSDSFQESVSASLDVPSVEGIDSDNKASALLSRINSIQVSKPK
jgi:recombination DNA repair RAD52 pathway protein